MQRSPDPKNCIRRLYQGTDSYVFAESADEVSARYGFEKIARLASNENPFGPSRMALDAVYEAARSLHRYPDTRNSQFIEALIRYHGDYQFVAGAGMDGVIETCIRALVEPLEPVAISIPTFSFYSLAAKAQASEVIQIPRKEDFTVDPAEFIKGAKGAKLSFLCSPNNPSGTVAPIEVIEEILLGIEGILFLDNAYVEFCEVDYQPLIRRYKNLIIGRTMSKVFGLAGCRVGYAFVPDWFRPVYEKAATPFALNSLSAAAATGALSDHAYVDTMVQHTRRWVDRFVSDCRRPVLPTGANFVMIDVAPMSGDAATEKLAESGVIVRSCRSFPGLKDHYIRVSVGQDWENERFIEVINRI